MKRAIHLDAPAYEVRKKERTDEGFLDIWGVAAKVGVLDYPEEGRKELVTEEALSGESAKSMNQATLTFEHPNAGEVNSQNWKREAVGHVFSVRYENGYQIVGVRVTDQNAIDAIEDGEKVQLSPGYDAIFENQSGTYEGEDYDVKQVGREVNHLALTDHGRGGDDSSLRVDSYQETDQTEDTLTMEDEVKENFEALRSRLDAMEEDAEDAQDARTDMKDKMDALMEMLKEYMSEGGEGEGKEDEDGEMNKDEDGEMKQDAFKQRFKAHREAIDAAEDLGLEVSEDDETADIKRSVVDEVYGERARLDSEAHLDAQFDIAVEQMEADDGPDSDDRSPSARKFERVTSDNRKREDSSRYDDDVEFVDPVQALEDNRKKSNE